MYRGGAYIMDSIFKRSNQGYDAFMAQKPTFREQALRAVRKHVVIKYLLIICPSTLAFFGIAGATQSAEYFGSSTFELAAYIIMAMFSLFILDQLILKPLKRWRSCHK
jgi:hypothetical protein